ncbi:hypothetical protein [Candidatus Nitrosocosmicus franklandus]|uniref:Uncharacterized protein n=1 Tax=Candidatus Nitrosocosmicus franklandianus TaxID=1798806 RepID=A0A484I606_9ARCH|nr:hypothetical protein [Candidatus Nitrosocosmicus franklandus]VFJ12618.1 protein of unknown function [Candidatus Nitrosocosmicus franklandus]
MDIHLRLIKIPTEESYYDDPITNTESMTVSTDRKEVLNELQTTLPGNFKDLENSSQTFGPHTMLLDKHGPEQGSILRNQIGNSIE